MNKTIKRFLIRSRLFAPIGIAIIISILIITIQSILNSTESIYNLNEDKLVLEVQTIKKMFEREKNLKLEKVKTHLKFAHDYFYATDLVVRNDSIEVDAINQLTGKKHKVWIKKWIHNNKQLNHNFSFVDKVTELAGGTATIFQKIDSGYLRLSTNVPKLDSSRAINTYIPNNSPVIKSIENNQPYTGRAYVVNNWYISAYEPIIINGKPQGILYVGNKEKDLPVLRGILNSLKIGNSGTLHVFDENGNAVIEPMGQTQSWLNKEIVEKIILEKKGKIRYSNEKKMMDRIIVFDYFEDFEFYIVGSVTQKDETKQLIHQTIKQSIIYAVIILVLLSLFVFFVTSKKLYRYLKLIEDSNKKLRSAHKALEYSENKFQTLFNNSSDEVFVADFKGNFVELNKSACESLEYSREELLGMNFFDIKTKKSRQFLSLNIKKIQEKGEHIHETEHLSKSGKVIQYEIKSKIIEYDGKKVILSIARNISERKALQKKIVQTIIETEMKERKRFSAELHDGLGPILSTIKLYSDLIKKGNFNNMSLEEAVTNIDELIEHAISSTKEISNNITPNVLDDFGLKVAIKEFCSFINRTQSINIDVDTKGYTIEKTGIETTVLYQTTKELINNTIKHAQAQNIRIQLKNINNQIILYYRDDGIGFNFDEKIGSGGLGLNNIINKIKTLKGTCDFNTDAGKGMFLVISLKLEEENSLNT
jgi:PAS domain S-box-containing protein